MQTEDSGLASYVAGQIDRSLSWKVRWNATQRNHSCSCWWIRDCKEIAFSLHHPQQEIPWGTNSVSTLLIVCRTSSGCRQSPNSQSLSRESSLLKTVSRSSHPPNHLPISHSSTTNLLNFHLVIHCAFYFCMFTILARNGMPNMCKTILCQPSLLFNAEQQVSLCQTMAHVNLTTSPQPSPPLRRYLPPLNLVTRTCTMHPVDRCINANFL